MKFYEVPTMNISEFAVENVVTESAAEKAAQAIAGANGVAYVKLEDWNEIAD